MSETIRECGRVVVNNPNGIDLIIASLEKLFGTKEVFKRYLRVMDLDAQSRSVGPDILEYVNSWEPVKSSERSPDSTSNRLLQQQWTLNRCSTPTTGAPVMQQQSYIRHVTELPILVGMPAREKMEKDESNEKNPFIGEAIIKLHHYFGHLHVDRLEKLIKKAGRMSEQVKLDIEELAEGQDIFQGGWGASDK